MGRTARALARGWRRRWLSPRRAFLPEVVDGAVAACPPATILLRQFDGGRCRRLDLALRLLALDDGAEGRRLYEAYRARRPDADKSLTGFLALLDDMRQHGFDPARPITVARDGAVPDGAHRLACAVHLGLADVPVRVVGPEHRFYAVQAAWFLRNGFTARDVALLEATGERYRRWARAAVP